MLLRQRAYVGTRTSALGGGGCGTPQGGLVSRDVIAGVHHAMPWELPTIPLQA